MTKPFKLPISVLVVIHTPALDVLLIQRADYSDMPGQFWQSVTGSQNFASEALEVTAAREVSEETGISCGLNNPSSLTLRDWRLANVYDIYPRWAHRYAPGITRNTEHLFSLRVPQGIPISLNPREHLAFQWLPWKEAAQQCYSPSNAEAILLLPRFCV